MMGANSLPDIAHLPEGLALRWAKEGRLLDLTPYLADNASFRERLPQSFYYYEPGKTIGTMKRRRDHASLHEQGRLRAGRGRAAPD